MTDHNPFEQPINDAPVADAPSLAPPERMPTGVMVFSIIAAVLGILGLFGSCFGAISFFANDLFASMLPPEAKAAMKEFVESTMVLTMIQVSMGILSSAFLLVAAIGCLTTKPWGGNWMRIAMALAALAGVIGICIATWMMISQADLMTKINQANGMSPDQARQVHYATQIFGILFSGAFTIFYTVGAVYFGKPSVTGFFERQRGAGNPQS